MADPSSHPAWLTPGQEVVIIGGRDSTPSPVLTIVKVMKRDVVLSNDDRWSLTRLAPNGEHITKRGGSEWAPHSALFPSDAPQVTKARREADRRSVASRCRTLSDQATDAIRRRDWDAARRAHAALGLWLEHAPEPPTDEPGGPRG